MLDLKLAEILVTYGIKGTFYVAPRNREFPAEKLLDDEQIMELARSFEIGSHTLTHPRLGKVDTVSALEEIMASKHYLEDVLGREVSSFCYPGGSYNRTTRKLVERAGYSYARTTRRFLLSYSRDPLLAATSLEVHRGPLASLPRDLLSIAGLFGLRPRKVARALDWECLAKGLFDRVHERGGVFHLWGHSWVLESFEDWAKLHRVLRHISRRPGVTYVPNRVLVEPDTSASTDTLE